MKFISVGYDPYNHLRICGEFELTDAETSYNEITIDNRCANQIILDESPEETCFEFWYDAVDPYEDMNKIQITLYKDGEVIINLEWEKHADIPMDLIYNCYYKVVHTKLKMYPNSQHRVIKPWTEQKGESK